MKDSIAGLIHESRGSLKCAKFTKGGRAFSAKEVNGRVSVYVNGVKKSRAAAEEILKEVVSESVSIPPAESFGPLVPAVAKMAAKFDGDTTPFSGPSVSQVEAGVKVKISGFPVRMPPGVYSARMDSVSVVDDVVTIAAKNVSRTWIFPMRNGIRSIMVGERKNK